jgi:hypothetical protein
MWTVMIYVGLTNLGLCRKICCDVSGVENSGSTTREVS